MLVLLISIIVLGVVAALLGWMHNRKVNQRLERGEISEEELTLPQVRNMQCCGQHEVCEKESLLAAVSKKVEYYDDEELDRFAGKTSADYSADEENEFRDILYTMQPHEVAGWVRSLQLRGVEVPDGIKDEVFVMVGEVREAAANN